jgi:hypothetical protein
VIRIARAPALLEWSVTFLFRTKPLLSIPQLVEAWGLELAKVGEEPTRCQKALEHLLLEDIINGRLDDTGPLRDERRLGVRLEFQGWPIFIEGGQIRPLICGPIQAISLHRCHEGGGPRFC